MIIREASCSQTIWNGTKHKSSQCSDCVNSRFATWGQITYLMLKLWDTNLPIPEEERPLKKKCLPVFRFQTPQIGFLTNFPYSFRISGIVEVASHDDLHYVRHVTARLKGPKSSDGTASSQPSQPLWATLWHSTDIKRAETLKTDSWFCLCCKSEWNSG